MKSNTHTIRLYGLGSFSSGKKEEKARESMTPFFHCFSDGQTAAERLKFGKSVFALALTPSAAKPLAGRLALSPQAPRRGRIVSKGTEGTATGEGKKMGAKR